MAIHKRRESIEIDQTISLQSESENRTLIQPFKSTSLALIDPTQTLTSKQIYEYIETIVITNETRHAGNRLSPQLIKESLQKLKSLLLATSTTENIEENDVNDEPEIIPIDEKSKQKFIPSSALLRHPLYSIDINRYFGVLRGSLRQDWNTIETDDDERNWEELKPSWFELFFDLMFVAAIVHISTEVADAFHHHEYVFIVTVFPQFGLLILCWLEQVLYHSRFRMTQTVDKFLMFIYMAFVLLMGLSIGNTNNPTQQKLFLIPYMFTKLVICLMFIKSSLIKRARNHSIYMIIENIISIVVIIFIEIFVNIHDDCYNNRWIWTIIYSLLFVYSWCHMVVFIYLSCINKWGVSIPINVPHIAERMGAFVLIILGETIISIMVDHVELTNDIDIISAYTVTMGFFIIVYCIGKLYFESQPTEYEIYHHNKSHAMSTSAWNARIYKWFHILLFFGLLGLGLGSKLIVHELPDYHGDDAIFVFMPGISCILISICINIIRLTHPFNYNDEFHHYLVIGIWILRIICLFIMFGVLFTWQFIDHFIIFGVYVICFIVQIFIDFEAKTRLIVTKNVDKNKSLHYYKSPKKDSVNFNGIDHHHHHQRQKPVMSKQLSFVGTF